MKALISLVKVIGLIVLGWVTGIGTMVVMENKSKDFWQKRKEAVEG